MTNAYIYSRIEGVSYPGITPDNDHEVRGMYVTGLTGKPEANMTHRNVAQIVLSPCCY